MTPNLTDARDEILLLYGNPMGVISSCIRGFLKSKDGYDLIACDFSNIEGRTLAWLAGEEWKIKAFVDFDNGNGPDLYKLSAARIYKINHTEVTKDQRMIGKVAELALGYQGGMGAFQDMAETHLVKVPDEQAKVIIPEWRSSNLNIKQFWHDINNAAVEAVRNRGPFVQMGQPYAPIKYLVKGSFLWCCLPSGRVICYPYPEIWKQVWVDFITSKGTSKKSFHGQTEAHAHQAADRYAKEKNWVISNISQPDDCVKYMSEDTYTKKWSPQIGYGGLWTENVTSGTARDILADAMFRLEDVNYEIVAHVHDELIAEVPEEFGSINEMADLMSIVPDWATGLPIAVGDPADRGWRGKRYRK